MRSFQLLPALLAVALLAGCPRSGPARDSGPTDVDSGGYDPVAGNAYEGPLFFDDARVMALDPRSLQGGAMPCRAPLLGRVTRITDGDTFHVSGVSEIIEIQVRLIGVNTPEVSAPAECFGPEASVFTQQLVGRLVWLTFDSGCNDSFGRMLAYTWIGGGIGDLWQRQLLRRGFARTLSVAPNTTYMSIFAEDQSAAQAGRVGLWSACP